MKKMYLFYTLLYLMSFIIEFICYLTFNSVLFGLIYLIINASILFLLIFTTINYSKKNISLRISKNIFIIFMILFTILILPRFKFIDESKIFIKDLKIFINFIKPLFAIMLSVICYLEFKLKNQGKYKIN